MTIMEMRRRSESDKMTQMQIHSHKGTGKKKEKKRLGRPAILINYQCSGLLSNRVCLHELAEQGR